MEERRNILRNEKGFTLIEIIAVLVILGILAVVAVPRYVDLQAQAVNRAAEGAVAASQSSMSMAFARQLLTLDGSIPTIGQVIAAAGTNCGVGTGDFTVTCAAVGNDVSISAAGGGGTATGRWTRP